MWTSAQAISGDGAALVNDAQSATLQVLKNMTLFIPDILEGAMIAPGHRATGRLLALWDWPELESHRSTVESAIVPAVRLVSITNIEIGSNHTPYHNGAPVFAAGLYPGYVEQYHVAGELAAPTEAEQTIVIDEATFCLTSFTVNVYGHFLLEMLPKILLALALREGGMRARIAFPSDAGAATDIVKHICPPESLLLYESRKQRLRLRRSLHPTLMHHGQLHDFGIALLRLLEIRLALAAPEPSPGRRLFLSREKWGQGYRRLMNEPDLFEVASHFGFELVHPQELPWPQQLRMFANATHVISAYNSALHGTLFCPRGASVISLGRVNALQDTIAASMAHHIGYLSPSRGSLSRHDPGRASRQDYEVSPHDLGEALKSMLS